MENMKLCCNLTNIYLMYIQLNTYILNYFAKLALYNFSKLPSFANQAPNSNNNNV